jgi:NAD(P)-dependent dehydrogenase (short-subunit alcohol dehydrogenase family)
VCRRLAKAGYQTILTARDGGKAGAAARALAADGCDVSTAILDVTSDRSICAAGLDIIERFGRRLAGDAARRRSEWRILQ